MVGSIGVGLNSALCTTLTVDFVLLHDPRSFKRLTLQQTAEAITAKGNTPLNQSADVYDQRDPCFILTWEPMPKPLWKRLFGVLDLVTSIRGVHWSSSLSSSLPSSTYQIPLGNAAFCRTVSLSRNGIGFLVDYLLIDLVKCLMISDPYFIGYSSSKALPHLIRYITSPLALHSYRMVLGLVGTFIAIDLIFSLAVLLQVNILGPKVLRLNASPALFPPLWG